MTFVDTSVIVRYLVGSSDALFEEAKTILEHTPKLVTTDVVLAEVFFVLHSVYKVPREKLIDVLVTLVQRRNILIFGLTKEVVIKGLLLCRPSGRVSLPNALIWAAALSSGDGVATVYSFDKRFPAEGIELRTTFS